MLKRKLEKIRLKFKKEDNLYRLFYALCDKTRFQIFKILLSGKDICVGELAYILGVTPPAISQHLKILELSNLVFKEKRGQFICYKINQKDKQVKLILDLIKGS